MKSKPYPSHEKYNTDEVIELNLLVAPAVMVREEIVVEKSDISKQKLESVIRNHLGLSSSELQKKESFVVS